jgi:short-subunit dehydrogenase
MRQAQGNSPGENEKPLSQVFDPELTSQEFIRRKLMSASSLKPLNQQVMVITGASSGIGLCTAKLAAERGAKVVLVARSAETLKKLVTQITNAGGEAIYVVADVADREKIQAAVQEALARFGRIDTWINDAGVSIYGRLEEVSDADSRRLFDTNFWGVVNGSLAALPHLKAQGGSLINVGSEVSEAIVPLQGMYSASKHAVKGFTDALRVEIEELDKAPVSITLIQPTAVNTPFPQHARNYMSREPKLPPPLINPEQVAEAILKAATEGGRDLKVGAMAVVNTAVSKLMPSLGDKMSAKRGSDQQEKIHPLHPQGALYEAGESGSAHGYVS